MQRNFSIRNIGRNKVAIFTVLILMAYYAANVIVSSGGNVTLGLIFRFVVYMMPFIIIIFILNTYGFSVFSDFGITNVKWTHLVLSFIVALMVYPGVIYFIGMPHPLAFFISIIIFVAFFMAVYYAISDKAFYGIIIYIVTMPFITFLFKEIGYKPEMFKIGIFSFHPSEIFLLSLFLIWLVSKIFKGNLSINHPVLLAFIFFISWNAVSIISSKDVTQSLCEWLSSFFYPALLFILLTNNIKTEKEIIILLYSLIYLAICTASFEFYFILRSKSQINVEILHATNLFWIGRGALILLAIPLNICLVRIISKKMQIPVILSLILLMILLIMDNTRVSIVALFISLIVFISSKKYRSMLIIMTLVTFIFWDYGLSLIFERFKHPEIIVYELSLKSWSPMRFEGIMAAFEMIKQYPIFGIGPGMWNDYYHMYGAPIFYPISGKMVPVYITSAHNGYLNYAVHSGLPSLIIWLSFLFALFIAAFKIIKNTKVILRKNVALGCFASIVALCVGSLGGTFQFSSNGNLSLGLLILAIMSILIALDRLEKSTLVQK